MCSGALRLPLSLSPRPDGIVPRVKLKQVASLLAVTLVLPTLPAAAGAPEPPGPAAARAQERPGTAADLRERFAQRLEEIARRVDGVAGYCIVDLTSGDRFTRLENAVFPTASTIKLAILYELFVQAQEGRLRLDQQKTLDRAAAVGGAGILVELGTPTLSLRDYAQLMILLSDNTATNVIIDAVGMANVTARMRALGLPDTRLRRKMMDGDAARRGDENVSTPNEMARLLEIFHEGQGLTPASREDALAILKKGRGSSLARVIPAGVEVASKAGDLDAVRADAGIVLAKNRPYLIAVMTSWLQDDSAGGTAIEDLSRAAYEYFGRLGVSSPYGRAIDR